MLRFDEGEEIFFDTVDCLLSEELVGAKEDLGCGNLGYEIWVNDLVSVEERRERFLSRMGFFEINPLQDIALGKESERIGMERTVECSGAISSSCGSSIDGIVEDLICNSSRELNGEANCLVDELEQDRSEKLCVAHREEGETACVSSSIEQFGPSEAQVHVKSTKKFNMDKKKMKSWWKHFINKRKGNQGKGVSEVLKLDAETKLNRMKVQRNKKRYVEFSAVYIGQEIHAHEGFIWTMKFSPDGKYLASGGDDGIVRIWRVSSVDVYAEGNSGSQMREGKSFSGRKKSDHASVVIPNKDFRIEESPLQEFHGHTGDVFDLAWSKSHCLLSSSKDKTVRLWQVGCNDCLSVFHHNSYVTCIQFNPADENYFISGSIDGKVRIWGLSKRRVVDWADVQDVVTAISYQPNGKGFVVGSVSGTCRFYESLGSNLQLNGQINIQGAKKSSGNKITGIQFSPEHFQRIIITSEDSKIRILDGTDVVQKYKGLPKSGSQMSASFASTGRHITSVGEDSRVYIWNYDDLCIPSFKQPKSVRSCEHFFSDGVSLAIPWSGIVTEQKGLDSSLQCCLQTKEHQDASSRISDYECFPLAKCFSMDGSARGSTTWPEEKLPVCDLPVAEHDQQPHNKTEVLSATWGLVIVTAGWDGKIRTFHNYGLPVRI
ncbi:uncharacterized protein LOC132267321 [Cornus florida]|uniref:uncharacterized protein LOC132267321 n=1 Tax=Cornus florida TaxID=4283 RepID=UPI00289E1234|nr:uncharacterized protein LOC132267321 [Cornus florida]XP_059624446.1 uncharacterized protein LOC132267321 [Cornus florida]